MITDTKQGGTLLNGGGAAPFESGGTVFATGLAEEGKEYASNETNGSAARVELGD